jgi:hypothetical protein
LTLFCHIPAVLWHAETCDNESVSFLNYYDLALAFPCVYDSLLV